jgi:ABC-type Fe3+/spermidine/putrescine transport system ATPase subunit
MTTALHAGGTAAPLDSSERPDGNSSPAIVIRNVSKRFGDSLAVDNVDLELASGEFFALLGPSGCGKTTTLRMVGGFELPSLGRIFLDGKDVTMLPPYKRDVNTVFQAYALFPHLSVFDNVAFGLRRKGLNSAEIRRRVEHDLEMVGLGGYGKRRPTQLSGGQQQRVALARALVNEPKVLLLDEPMGALDAKIRKSMQLELKRIQREVGITFLYVTHDQSEAMSMADRLAVMNGGKTEDIGTPDRVYDRPATQFVADFLGTCNVFPLESDGVSLRLPDGSAVEVDNEERHKVLSNQARVGIRPEKLVVTLAGSADADRDVISRDVNSRDVIARSDAVTHPDAASRRDHRASSAANRLRGTVITATYLGASTEYEIETSWGSVLKAFAQNLSVSSRARPGDLVEVTWDASHCFILPPLQTASPAETATA